MFAGRCLLDVVCLPAGPACVIHSRLEPHIQDMNQGPWIETIVYQQCLRRMTGLLLATAPFSMATIDIAMYVEALRSLLEKRGGKSSDVSTSGRTNATVISRSTLLSPTLTYFKGVS
jgi:hypothetical protein